jgi:hypothetical protein
MKRVLIGVYDHRLLFPKPKLLLKTISYSEEEYGSSGFLKAMICGLRASITTLEDNTGSSTRQ